MTRLVFHKNEDGTTYSTNQFIAREKLIIAHVVYCGDHWMYLVIDLGAGNILFKGNYDTIHKCKSMVKLVFKDLGVKIHDEVRKKVK